MKLNLGKRILMFFHWLYSLVICVMLTLFMIRPQFLTSVYEGVMANLTASQRLIVGVSALAIYAALAVAQVLMIFEREKAEDRGFINVDSGETGHVRIAVAAVEQMVRQSVTTIDGISDMKIGIGSQEDAIVINIAATLQSGAHVPTVTMNMQQAIRHFVEKNCGVAVRSVSISINAVTTPQEGGRRRGRRAHAEVPPMPQYTPEPVGMPFAAPPASEPPKAIEESEPLLEKVDVVADDDADDSLPEIQPIKLVLNHSPASDDTEAAEAPKTAEED